MRALADGHGQVWVFTGPVFVGKRPMNTIGQGAVAVPTHTFKVILCVHGQGEKEMFAFVIPNLDKVDGRFAEFAHTVNFVERLTALDFFDKLPASEQRRLERVIKDWPAQ